MQIVLSVIEDDPRSLYKHPNHEIELAAEIKEDVQIMTPVFYIVYNAAVLNLHYNYCFAFNRYYYITDITVTTGGSMRVSCREDVLYTYADQIVNCPIIADRSDSTYNAYIQDPERRFYQYTVQQYVTLGDIGKPNIICLVTVG